MPDFPKVFLKDDRARTNSPGEQSGWSPWKGMDGAALLTQTGFAVRSKVTISITPGVSVASEVGVAAQGMNILVRNATSATIYVELGTAGVVADATDFPVPSGSSTNMLVQAGQTHIAVLADASATGQVYAWTGYGSSVAAGETSDGVVSFGPISQSPVASITTTGNFTLIPAVIGKTIHVHDILLNAQLASATFAFYSGATLLMPLIAVPQYGGYDDRDVSSPLFICGADQPFILNVATAGSGFAGLVGYRYR